VTLFSSFFLTTPHVRGIIYTDRPYSRIQQVERNRMIQKFKLPPDHRALLQPFFPSSTLDAVTIKEYPATWAPFWLSKREDGTPTPAFTIGSTIYVVNGFYNEPGRTWGNTMDLSTIEGIVTLGHEMGHVHHVLSRGWVWALFATIRGIFMSISQKRVWYSHQVAPAEVELIEGRDRDIVNYYLEKEAAEARKALIAGLGPNTRLG
jgi:hypothetical protein